jgi:hypothetical protein
LGWNKIVEYVHNQHLVAETRERLQQERAFNRKQFALSSTYVRWETAEYENNMLVLVYLQQHPGTPQEKLPGILAWGHNDARPSYSAWDTAQETGLTALMPQDEVAEDAAVYKQLHLAEDMAEAEFTVSHQAEAYIYQDPNPSHLTPAEVADEIKLTRTLLMQHERYILALRIIDFYWKDFTSGPTSADLAQIRNVPDQQTQKLLAPAIKLTMDRLKAAGVGPAETSRPAF